MGRKATRNTNLPRGMRARHRGKRIHYYLDTGGTPRKEIPLGNDYVLAIQKWAELVKSDVPNVITFRYVAEQYEREVIPHKAPRTQKDNKKELAWLLKFFDEGVPIPLSKIEPINVRQYLDWRKDAPVRANREKALFSHIWNFARGAGLTNKPNPCAGIKGYKETGRDIYIEDQIYKAVWDAAEMPLRDAIDLAYLIGQRPADVLKLLPTDIIDGALWVTQNKTKKKLRISIEGELAVLVKRIQSRETTGPKLINLSFRGAFDRARTAASLAHPELSEQIWAFQFRDLRAKAGTDTEEHNGIEAAQNQLGHATSAMTAHYVRHRRGKLVKPTK